MVDHFDYAILGAGCSGLSLAVELMKTVPKETRVVIIDPRESFTMDRIWCFWNTVPHGFEAAVTHHWNRWRVRLGGNDVTHESLHYSYQYLPSDRFYAAALRVIHGFPSADLRLKTRALGLLESSDRVHIQTDREDLTARVVFDGRNTPESHINRGCLLQHYAGQRIRTRAPVFDPGIMTLMDFDVTQRYGITFVYLLPFSETEALVEPTVFSRFPLGTGIYTGLIRRYLKRRFDVDHFDVGFQEAGVIPMSATITPPTSFGRVIPIGTAAGVVKGSTGYGFLAIQQWCRAVVESVVGRSSGPPRLPRSRLSSSLDRIFLAFLESNPKRAPEVFQRLFQRVPAERLVRFLSDQPKAMDVAAVVTSMPTLPFIQQAVRVWLPAEDSG